MEFGYYNATITVNFVDGYSVKINDCVGIDIRDDCLMFKSFYDPVVLVDTCSAKRHITWYVHTIGFNEAESCYYVDLRYVSELFILPGYHFCNNT